MGPPPPGDDDDDDEACGLPLRLPLLLLWRREEER